MDALFGRHLTFPPITSLRPRNGVSPMRPLAFRMSVSALLFASFLTSAALAADSDTTTVRHATPRTHGSIALASFRVGARLASRIRYPAGVGLGIAVCAAGIALEIDHYVRSR